MEKRCHECWNFSRFCNCGQGMDLWLPGQEQDVFELWTIPNFADQVEMWLEENTRPIVPWDWPNDDH